MDFHKLKTAVEGNFNKLAASGNLYTTSIAKDDVWNTYLASFPTGTNPKFRERTEHDCSCCKQFIRTVGNVVAIVDGKMVSVWDCVVPDENYQKVVNIVAEAVKIFPIQNAFLHYERHVGIDKNYEEDEGQAVRTWEHFHVELPKRNTGRDYVQPKANIPTIQGEARALHDVLLRSLTELTLDSVNTVLELIAQNSLYRGQEHKFAVDAFCKAKVAFDKLPELQKDLFVWEQSVILPGSVSKIRNTSIGTLLTELSEGMALETAVTRFEKMVAPTNYKRSTALVTEAMVTKAKETIESLGLLPSLERRFANLADVSVNNVLFADRTARKTMNDDVFGGIANKPKVQKNLSKVETVTIDEFITSIVPNVETIEVMVENKQVGNLVSLIAPKDKTAKPLFKWDNNFSWDYNGGVADSMSQLVQERGGRVDGVLRFTHMWNHIGRNASLMDLHVFMPGSREHREGAHDGYPSGRRVGWNHRRDVLSGGVQDVDYVDAAPEGHVPVENITFPTLSRMPDGIYTFKIHNWNRRLPTDSGFSAQIAFGGQVFAFEHPAPLKNKEWVTVAKIELKKGKFEILSMMPSTQSPKTVWGIRTQDFHKVNVLMMSPNYWNDKGVGNKHYFFMLDGCKNDGQARGFFNEFLRSELDPHRKVIELLGSRMKTEETPDQLSGLGISSTQKNELLVRVEGNFKRTLKVTF